MTFEPCDTINIIYGDNAQGKTNILEAIWLLTGAKSFRMSKDIDYIQFEKQNAIIESEFFGSGREQTIQLCYGNKKKVFLNEIALESSVKLAGNFNAVVFSPVHLSLIKDGPALRRKFVDSAICQLMPKYINYLAEYNRILNQRNALLKDAVRHSALLDTLDVWDYHLAKAGGYILPARLKFVSLLAEKSKEIYYGISDQKEQLNITYLSSGNILNYPIQQSELREYLFEMLTKTRAIDLAQGVTTTGIHRDDIEISIDGVSLRSYGSQGQQRSSVLALKLAECGILYESIGEHPIILLDDVMSELDEKRRDYLLNNIQGKQVFITCCDTDCFSVMKQGKTFNIKNGQIITVNSL